MDYQKLITTRASNLLNRTPHESDGRVLWTYRHDGQWHVTDETPVKAGKDGDGRLHVDVKVKESFDDAESLQKAQRENGFHSWKGTI